ncbi:MAG: DUF1538 domain-containing protein [Gammaproteobacteria bacterium]|jgi:hypothetical protein|nr:DUF1538 domain-containing protein [Gammaproteobacteria bacterium]MBT4607501.1 DUF1538 domain-containing protein [Thiotrichales bacterium]MBT3472174.1 DUF1538 domain-containing protein [Gammaproteobacteria bacterium]MBT3967297.1 DUF1538 domain-containing protein [Gammaproteobacteria bacterium]MBT4082125.1 DUF1538 domain-containing protein [Gammaproteobacteria bacterium]
MGFLAEFQHSLIATAGDMLPIVGIIFGFQLAVIRRRIPNLKRVLIGFFYVLLGLSLFLMGLEQAIFPLGEQMATQLSDPKFILDGLGRSIDQLRWSDYYWVYLFAFLIGFSTTIAEPSLLAVALKAEGVSGGTVAANGLRIAVALGVAVGITLGAFRIVSGIPLYYFIVTGYLIVMIQTYFAPKFIIALAYDSGGVTTSTVTVPLVAALGLGLATSVPGRSAMLDGFGLIAFASLLPIIAVLGYVQLSEWMAQRSAAADEL